MGAVQAPLRAVGGPTGTTGCTQATRAWVDAVADGPTAPAHAQCAVTRSPCMLAAFRWGSVAASSLVGLAAVVAAWARKAVRQGAIEGDEAAGRCATRAFLLGYARD